MESQISKGLFLLLSFATICIAAQPNIIFIVADDLGWNDVGWHNPHIYTPNLDRLAATGVKLEQYYVQAICTPSRSAFMTGYYPFRTGMQHGVIKELEPVGLPVNFTLLPQYLQSLGYSTHMVGKWHLGYCDWKYTPTYRGFESFFGYYNGDEDYYTHQLHDGLDLHENRSPVYEYNGTYSAHIFTDKAKEIISKHNPEHPLFLYLPYQSVHAPLEVPEEYTQQYSFIKDKYRRTFSGMVTALDEAVGNITESLIQKGLYDNSVIIFTSDNGGQTQYGGNNYPLRGNKNTLWEGGHRVPAFVHSPLLEKSYINTKLIHAVDWLPTILHIAAEKQTQSVNLDMDGRDQWTTISNDINSARNEFVYNIDNKGALNAAIRMDEFKLIVGNPGEPSGWIPPSNCTTSSITNNTTGEYEMYLFNISSDPTEHYNLAQLLPATVDLLWERLQKFVDEAVPPFKRPVDPSGDPRNFGGAYSPGWCTAEPRFHDVMVRHYAHNGSI